jgi:hypothetical protein
MAISIAQAGGRRRGNSLFTLGGGVREMKRGGAYEGGRVWEERELFKWGKKGGGWEKI